MLREIRPRPLIKREQRCHDTLRMTQFCEFADDISTVEFRHSLTCYYRDRRAGCELSDLGTVERCVDESDVGIEIYDRFDRLLCAPVLGIWEFLWRALESGEIKMMRADLSVVPGEYGYPSEMADQAGHSDAKFRNYHRPLGASGPNQSDRAKKSGRSCCFV